jgi:hypothetical protein
MAKLAAAYETCPAALRLPNGNGVLAPFSPQSESPLYWAEVLDLLREGGTNVDFIPILLNPGEHARGFGRLSSAMSFWGFRDPAQITGPRGQALMADVRKTAPAWMQPIAPQDFRPKDAIFWEARNTEAFRAGWMEAINSHARYAHVITWNDYSEATEIAPSSGTQFLFYDLTAYYGAWFKTGAAPKIRRDAIYYSHRNQIFTPDTPPRQGDTPFKRLGDTPLANDIEMLVFLTKPAELEIEIGGQHLRHTAPAGLASFRVPAVAGTPIFRILRANALVVEKRGDWTIEAKPEVASGLYLGGSSTRDFIRLPPARK